MIYLIGGASRAGKTHLARRLMQVQNTPFIELDYLKMGFANGMPEYGVHPLQDEETIGAKLWPFVSGMVKAMVENRDDYVIEGVYVLPKNAAQLRLQYGPQIRACFLGYANADPVEKLTEIQRYGDGQTDFLGLADRESALEDIARFISFSAHLATACPQLGFAYFDAADRETAVRFAMDYLLSD